MIHALILVSVDPARIIVTASIKPREAALTPSRKPLASGDFRSLGINGLLMRTKMNDGRKMPVVATRGSNTRRMLKWRARVQE